jgi:chemotaxis protein CheD
MDQIRRISPRHSPTRIGTSSHAPNGVKRIRIFAGDVATSVEPAEINTLLGSCVAVCLFDPELRGGGMNHIMLPGNARDTRSTRFGVQAMELLINDLLNKGGVKRRFVAKAFGGATVLSGLKFANVGDDNVKFVQDFLAFEKIPLVAGRLGGLNGLHVYFRTDTGDVRVKSLDGKQLPTLIQAESSYRRAHEADQESTGEITLF